VEITSPPVEEDALAGLSTSEVARRSAAGLVSAPKATVVREGQTVEVPAEEVVLGAVMDLSPGDQVVAHATALVGEAEVGEWLATGESDRSRKPRAPSSSPGAG